MNSNYSERISKIETELFKIIADNTQQIYNLTMKYNDLLPAIAVEKRANDTLNIQKKLKNDLESFIKKYEAFQIQLLKEVRKKTLPLIYSTYTERFGGYAEWNNALYFVNNLPSNYLSILQMAWLDNRPDFIFSVAELVSGNDKISGTVKSEVEKLSYQIKNEMGILENETDGYDISELLKQANDLLGISYDVNKPIFDSLHTIALDKLSTINPALYVSLKEQKYKKAG